jgi:hypothetical protein
LYPRLGLKRWSCLLESSFQHLQGTSPTLHCRSTPAPLPPAHVHEPAVNPATTPLSRTCARLMMHIELSGPQIRNLAAANLEQLSSIMDPVVLLPPLTSALDFGNPRARSALAERLRALLPGISERKPQLLHKHAVPSTLRLLEDHRADVRAATASLVRDLHLALGGDGLLAAPRLTDRQKQRVRDIISSA